jgi:putative membrane protein
MTSTILELFKAKKQLILIVILIIFYTVGTIGILSPSYTNYFLPLSFFNLLLSFIVILIATNKLTINFLLFILFCFLVGIVIELIGTKTGLLFGDYAYGKNLGIKISGVPIVIGINWAILIITSASITNRLHISVLIKIILSAVLMTFLDILMEPVAIKSDFWHWNKGVIPFYNYVCWFFISLLLNYLYFTFKLVKSNKVYDTLFIIILVFFSLLNIF